ncbi:ECF transporter S component [Lederbergia lenta]|uniref:Riboflavin transporter n=1 Tax=Lederbergia lenta TaxID=1467 RepID=A0A2X4W946_LEDLE|nr:ECF transporter S component [Lederbergia lenta]MCM3111585.1 ECF transporter S component [Lederbergia lenta]MEC2325027.1 ECF transporter S component [Lederbergia lenta]SQI56478.1 FMN permease [Lederbergia lenta]
MKKFSVKSFVAIGMLSSLSFILMLIKFPIPPFPAWLTVDFSDIPALIAALLFGPLAAVLVELFKNVLDYVMIGSEAGLPIGNMANFLAGVTFVLPVYYVHKHLKMKKGLALSMVAGTIVMAIIMSIMNYLWVLPAYTILLGWDPMSTSAMRQVVVAAILPFNVIKGLLITMIFLLLYSRLQVWLNKQKTYKNA